MSQFGSVFFPEMILARFDGESWGEAEFVPSDKLTLHPGAHVLHYASTCFEGLKAFRHPDGRIAIFRMDQNIARLAQSSALLSLPEFEPAQLAEMITTAVARYADQIPTPPESLYIRPTHIGTEPCIGKAAAPSLESLLYVLLSPVGDYFAGGLKPLRLLVEQDQTRCSAHMGMVKSGGNYASAMYPTMAAKKNYKADQVLFAPGGDVQETGAANFLLFDGNELITKALDSSFLHGVTRSSILTLARDRGIKVTERNLTVTELLERVQANPNCEAALSGTAAVLAHVGTLISDGKEYTVGSGQAGPLVKSLREELNAIQWGLAEDRHGWLTFVN